jgi:cellobiose-specific phosphotransferase system component IIA
MELTMKKNMRSNKASLEHAEELVRMAREEYDLGHLAHAQVLLEAAASMYELDSQWDDARRCLETAEQISREVYAANGPDDTKAVVNLLNVRKHATTAIEGIRRGDFEQAIDSVMEMHEHQALADEALQSLTRTEFRQTLVGNPRGLPPDAPAMVEAFNFITSTLKEDPDAELTHHIPTGRDRDANVPFGFILTAQRGRVVASSTNPLNLEQAFELALKDYLKTGRPTGVYVSYDGTEASHTRAR